MKFLILSLVLCFRGVFIFPQEVQEKRMALIIGNGKYAGSILANPENDARAMKEALKGLGFIVYEYENIGQGRMKEVIDEFGAVLRESDVGLFYYAGHGIQSKGYNYLIPVDAVLKTEEQVEYDCVRADRILSLMETSGTRINIIILDACRNNPFERGWTRSATGRGLAFMDAPKGTIIAYATAPGTTASDGTDRNGLYTSAILESIIIPGISILQMFQNVRNIVSAKSGNNQVPWESTSLTGDFFFRSAGVPPEMSGKDIEAYAPDNYWSNESAGYLTDSRDNHRYRTVVIGDQVWLAENLAFDPGGGSWTYENTAASALIYGRLYDWVTARMVCPSGWHLPGNEEWSVLSDHLGGDSVAGGRMKEKGTRHWKSPNTGATDEAGFNALPAGAFYSDGKFFDIWLDGRWWSETEESGSNAWSVLTTYNDSAFFRRLVFKKMGLSVRCVKD